MNLLVRSAWSAIAILAVAGLCGNCGTPRVPRDGQLLALFAEHRGEFEKLRDMAQEDTNLLSITSTFVVPRTSDTPGPDVLPEARWNEYREAFERLGITQGIAHYGVLQARTSWFEQGGL